MPSYPPTLKPKPFPLRMAADAVNNMNYPFGINKREFLRSCLGASLALTAKGAAPSNEAAASRGFRPPSVPLITCDPYLSIWSNSDLLTGAPTQHWTRKPHRLTSFVRIDNAGTFRLMGDEPKGIPAMAQISLAVHPTRTVYTFAGAGIEVELAFGQAALPNDLMLLSRPLGYLTWTVRSTDNGQHTVSLYLQANPEIAVNTPSQQVIASDESTSDLAILRTGSKDQTVLFPKGDDVRIDWGYLYLSAPKSEGLTFVAGAERRIRRQFSDGNPLTGDTDLKVAQPADSNAAILALSFALGSVGTLPVTRWAMLAYDEVYAVQFFEQNLRPYWRKDGADAINLLQSAAADYASVVKRCADFDRELVADAIAMGGEQYGQICALAYRQCLAGNKIAVDAHGQPLLFPKENTSNGCIGTVDVIYPMAPQFLLFSPSLAKAMLVYNLEYASSKRWRFPFAPHDVGTYPQANGQVYGGGERTEENQMPVEETGNMLILVAAIAHMDGNASFVEPYWPTIQKWADYLKAEGFDPSNQLCTDDFAGHLAHNVNLSAKAIVGLGAYAHLCRMRNDTGTADTYGQLAKQYAARWEKEAADGDHYRLTFDKSGTWSQKYNLVWDNILGFDLFSDKILQTEMHFYKKHLDRYGLPLDSRKPWTKTDWTLWTASLTNSKGDFEPFARAIYTFVNGTTDRIPFSDFYWTQDATDAGMHARPVIGGVFLRMLYDKALWKKWSSRDTTNASNWAPFPTGV